jgi:hypothetical protein
LEQSSIIQYIAETFEGVTIVTPEAGEGPEIAVGDTFFIYNPDHSTVPKHQMPFATIVTKDYGDFDCASNLDRPGVYRLNIGVGKELYRSLFGPQPPPPEGGKVQTGHDFTVLDTLMPHPVYAPQSWICVLNPSETTFEAVKPYIADAYSVAKQRRHGAADARPKG